VEDLRFLVHFNSLQIRIKESGELWEVDDPQRKYQIGDRVYLTWEDKKVMLLK
jgi:iron(III) transport system ATP-binding protein